ncbi:exodeoxyribonuclease VII large subunit [Candidatus Saccharibacteria bacterium]|nr:exodeoxyribonuclease VII large subunit [Candidatus Saccharibacteria bacterium]
MLGQDPVFSVSDAISVLNQTLEYAYPTIQIEGEISEFRVSKNKWVYFDIKDDESKIRCFGLVFQLTTPIEDGMKVLVIARPRLHNLYGFSLNILSIKPVGEGSIKKSQDLLKAKLEKEGLFSDERKRTLPYAPEKIGLITSEQSAAYADFIKIMNTRWQDVEVNLYNVAVQGEEAGDEIIKAINYFNLLACPPEVLVIIRGGGSADDLSAFSLENVTRAVAGSRIPSLVAVGHEVDVSLAELAADMRASTPSNAAELLFPDKSQITKYLNKQRDNFDLLVDAYINNQQAKIDNVLINISHQLQKFIDYKLSQLTLADSMLEGAHPRTALKRGFAIVQKKGKLVSSIKQLSMNDNIEITLSDGEFNADVRGIIKS